MTRKGDIIPSAGDFFRRAAVTAICAATVASSVPVAALAATGDAGDTFSTIDATVAGATTLDPGPFSGVSKVGFDSNGKAISGTITIGGKTYAWSGNHRLSGLVIANGKASYLDPKADGAAVTDTWAHLSDGTWMHFGADGTQDVSSSAVTAATDAATTVGTVPDASCAVNFDGTLPSGTTFDWVAKPDVSKAGNATGTVRVGFPDGTTQDVSVSVTVSNGKTQGGGTSGGGSSDPSTPTSTWKAVGGKVSCEIGKLPDARDAVSNAKGAPEGTTFSWATAPDVSKAGEAAGTVSVTLGDGSTQTVQVSVTVMKPKGSETGSKGEEASEGIGQAIHRLSSPGGDHLYTANDTEAARLAASGWTYEGTIGGTAATGQNAKTVYRLYNPNASQHHFTASKGEADSLVKAGWKLEGSLSVPDGGKTKVYRLAGDGGNRHMLTTSAGERAALLKAGWKDEGVAFTTNGTEASQGHWLVTESSGLHRFWFGKDGTLACGRLISDDEGAGYAAYAAKDGHVICGKETVGDRVLLATSYGRLETGTGWIVTGTYDGGAYQRYYLEKGSSGVVGAKTGLFTVDGKEYYGIPGKGYVLRGTMTVGDWTYTAGNDGAITKKEHNELGNRMAAVARACTSGQVAFMGGIHTSNPWGRPTQASLQTYARVFDATVGAMHGNTAYASCAQAASSIVAATIDRSAATMGAQADHNHFRRYLEAHPEWYQNLGVLDPTQYKPGDILAANKELGDRSNHNHIMIVIAHSGTNTICFSAHYGGSHDGWYPAAEVISDNQLRSDFGAHVFRPIAKGNPIDVSGIVGF